MQPMQKGLSREEVIQELNPGDEVSIYTRNSEKHLIVVDTITKDHIEGGGKAYKFEDIIEIRQKKFSIAKTASAVLGGSSIILIALVMLVIFAAGG